jgi:hypothetical protein
VFIGGLMHFAPVSAPANGLIDSVIGDGAGAGPALATGAGAGAALETGSGAGSTLGELAGPLITRLPIPTMMSAATISPAINLINSLPHTYRLTR